MFCEGLTADWTNDKQTDRIRRDWPEGRPTAPQTRTCVRLQVRLDRASGSELCDRSDASGRSHSRRRIWIREDFEDLGGPAGAQRSLAERLE